MKNKIKIMALVMGMVIIVSGCGKGTVNETKVTTKNTEQSMVTESKKSEVAAEEKYGLKMLAGEKESYDTEEGRYYIPIGEENAAIRYIDYKAKKEVYLCNKLNCEHNNKNCTAVLPNQDFSAESCLFGDGKYIYILTTPYDSAGSMEVEEYNRDMGDGAGLSPVSGSNEAPAIYRMNKDGSDREKVFELESGVIAEAQVIGDGKYLYIVTKKNKSESKGNKTYHVGYDRKLIKIDLEKESSEEVTNLKAEQNIIGCSGRNLIVSEDDFGRELSFEEQHDDDTYNKLFEKSKHIISSMNIDTGKVTELKSMKNSKDKLTMEKVWNDKLYVSSEGEKYLEITDLKSGEKENLKLNDAYTIEEIISIKNGADVVVGTPYSDIGSGDEKGWSNYLINTKTGKVTKSTLQDRYNKPIRIEAQNEEYLYVENNSKNTTEYVAWAGVNQEVVSEVEYSLISKKDYLANKANYQKMELLNGGKVKDED